MKQKLILILILCYVFSLLNRVYLYAEEKGGENGKSNQRKLIELELIL
jgi:hypothetical protein